MISRIFLVIILVFSTNFSLAQEIIELPAIKEAPQEDNQTTVQLKDGKIQVTKPNEWTKTLDYSKENKYIDRGLKKWVVSEQSNPVDQALAIYKKKGNIYSK